MANKYSVDEGRTFELLKEILIDISYLSKVMVSSLSRNLILKLWKCLEKTCFLSSIMLFLFNLKSFSIDNLQSRSLFLIGSY